MTTTDAIGPAYYQFPGATNLLAAPRAAAQ